MYRSMSCIGTRAYVEPLVKGRIYDETYYLVHLIKSNTGKEEEKKSSI